MHTNYPDTTALAVKLSFAWLHEEVDEVLQLIAERPLDAESLVNELVDVAGCLALIASAFRSGTDFAHHANIRCQRVGFECASPEDVIRLVAARCTRKNRILRGLSGSAMLSQLAHLPHANVPGADAVEANPPVRTVDDA